MFNFLSDLAAKLFLTESRVNRYVDLAVEASEEVLSDKSFMNGLYLRLADAGLDCLKYIINTVKL